MEYYVIEKNNNYFIVKFYYLLKLKQTQPNISYRVLDGDVLNKVIEFTTDKKLEQLEGDKIINVNYEYSQYLKYKNKNKKKLTYKI